MRAATLITTLRARVVATTTATMLVIAGSVAITPAAVSAESDASVAGNQISGTVTGAGRDLGLPVKVYEKQADDSWTRVATVFSQDDDAGRYATGYLAAGSYRIQVDGGHEFKSEFYDDVQTADVGDDAIETITLDGSPGNVGVDFDLEAYELYAVSGTASWSSGATGTFTVYATKVGETESVNDTVSSPFGQYSINLRPGAYTLKFWDNMGRILDK